MMKLKRLQIPNTRDIKTTGGVMRGGVSMFILKRLKYFYFEEVSQGDDQFL